MGGSRFQALSRRSDPTSDSPSLLTLLDFGGQVHCEKPAVERHTGQESGKNNRKKQSGPNLGASVARIGFWVYPTTMETGRLKDK